MSADSPLNTVASRLFDSARSERPDAAARQRTLRAVLDAIDGSEANASRPALGTMGLLLGGVALAAAVAIWAFVPAATDATRFIGPEPVRSLPTSPAPSARHPALDSARTLPTPPSGAPVSAHAPIPSSRPMTLADEVALLDRARGAIRDGRAKAALGLLDEYYRRRGERLRDEATLLRIQALAGAGRSAEAAKLAESFVASNPGSTLVDRARHYVRASGGEP
jgi:hypothetical protein